MTANATAAAVTVPTAFQVPNTLEMRSAPLEGFEVCAAPPAFELVTVTVVTLPSTVLVTTVSVVAAAGEVVETLEAAETAVVRFEEDDVAEAEAPEADTPEGKSVKVEKMAGPGPVGKLPGSKGVPDGVEVLLLLPGADDDAVGGSGRMVGNVSRFETVSNPCA